MDEKFMEDINNRWDSSFDLNTKISILEELFMVDNGEISESSNEFAKGIADDLKKYQTIDNLNVFDEFFSNDFNPRYANIISYLKNYICVNITNDLLNRINLNNDISTVKKYISDITNSNLYKNDTYDIFNITTILNNIDVDNRIDIIDSNTLINNNLKDVINRSRDEEKEIFLDRYSRLLDNYDLKNIIIGVNDENIRKQLVFKYINLFNDYIKSEIISSFKNYDNIKELLNNCQLDYLTISNVITNINDDDAKIKLTELYLNNLDELSLMYIISSCNNSNNVFYLFKLCINKLRGYTAYQIFNNLYNRYIDADRENNLDSFNELSNILDEIVDNYLEKFYSKDASEILSLYDYEDKIKFIDKYLDKIQFNWNEIIVDNDNFEDTIKLYNRYLKHFTEKDIIEIIKSIEIVENKKVIIDGIIDKIKSEQLCEIILEFTNIDDINKFIYIYQDKLLEVDLIKIICEKYSDADKLIYLNRNISQESKCKIISSINDETIKIKYIEDNSQIINGSNLVIILETFSNDADKIKYLYKYEQIFDGMDLTNLICSIKNFDKKLTLIEKYGDKLDIIKIAFYCNSKKALFLMKKYSVYFDAYMLATYLVVKDNKNEFVNEFFETLPSESIAKYIINKFSDLYLTKKLKLNLINKHFTSFSYHDIEEIFTSLDAKEKNILLDNHIDNMDSKKICLFLATYNNTNDVLELLKKYSDKINKDDIIYIVLGQIRNILNNSENFNKDNLIYLYSLISNENEKNNNIINNLLSLDIFSINAIKEYLLNNDFKDYYNFDSFVNIVVKLSKSNSTEIQHLTPNLVGLLMGKDKQEQDKIINELENVFLRNNLPMMAKLYKVFDIMHPNFSKFNGFDYQSPNLKNKNNFLFKQIILFADLMRITVGSNNRSLKEYVKHIEVGNEIAKQLIFSDVDIDLLDDSYKEILINYLNHLETLYNNTLYGKNNPVKLSGNIKKDILMFISKFGKNEKEFDINKLPNRIVKMFGHFAGIDTIDELKILMDTTIKNADNRNRVRALNGKFEIHKGYFIKGIANQDKEDEFYSFLTNIFQNGSLCKELLGDAARSDTTPMDTDVSRMLEEPTSFLDAFTNPKYASSRYGPLWIVLKDDDRFNETNKENNKYIPGKLEVFETSMDGEGHYGIRTGFASSDIDYLVVDESKIKMDRIKYEIVMNGFYIPLVNTKGNLVFTPEEYDELHEKMAGLSYYGTESEYKFASEIDDFDINNTGYNIDIVNSINEVTKVREEVINKLRETGLNIKLGRSLDLKDKCIDLIDTGSTSRGTNKMDGYDFDFVMRVDKEIYTSDEKINELYQSLKNVFPDIDISGHKIRKYKLKLENGQEVELDITFIMKTNKMDYSTEECLQDRLNTIKNMDEEKYKKVLENIVLAKYVLGGVYKSKNVAENPQGGLGGVGIENWILQNGGSFERAARSFIEKAEGKSFREFTKEYTIWDFGQNNLSFKRDDGYTHDEFITNNMNEEGYNKMVSVLNEYIYTLEQSKQL